MTDLDGFYTEHQRCGELDGEVDDVMVWGLRVGRPGWPAVLTEATPLT